MLRKGVFFQLIFFLWFFHLAHAYGPHSFYAMPDSLIRVEGQVLSAATKAPLHARIIYTMLPYGSITGAFSFNKTDGSFTFTLPSGGDYRIEVSSEGYQTASETIIPGEQTNENGKIVKTFYLYGSLKKGGFIKLKDKIYFDQGNARLSEESTEALQEIVNILESNPKMVIQLEGHTESGDRKSLLRLSERRVQSVKDYLINQGIHHKRIRTKAYGGTLPLSQENSEEARQINRRVEIRIIKM
jgi:OmpA-OmpF porin, OOP family